MENRIRPEPSLVKFLRYEFRQPRVEDVDEALYLPLILADDLVADGEDIKRHGYVISVVDLANTLLLSFTERFRQGAGRAQRA